MTDATQRDPIRCIAHDAASDAVPLAINGTPDFDAWSAVVRELAGDIEHTIRSEVDA